MMNRSALLVIVFCLFAASGPWTAYASENVFRAAGNGVKRAGKQFGKDAKSAGKQAGRAGKQVGREIGKAGKNVGKSIGKEAHKLFND
jgi:hypothetical protein